MWKELILCVVWLVCAGVTASAQTEPGFSPPSFGVICFSMTAGLSLGMFIHKFVTRHDRA